VALISIEQGVRLLIVLIICVGASLSAREAIVALRTGTAYLYLAGWRYSRVRREDDPVGYSTLIGANAAMAGMFLWVAALVAMKVI
jgi:hypothetical protein